VRRTTPLGRIERGFDFLGYHFGPAGLTVAKKTIANFIEKASRLYEQKRSAVLAATALEMYVRQWVRWAGSECLNLPDHNEMQLMASALARGATRSWRGPGGATDGKSYKSSTNTI
jgi:hypothetical protein